MRLIVTAFLLAGAVAIAAHDARAQAFPIVVNECASGSSGWIELFNRGAQPLDFASDQNRCWLVDDSDGGGAPKVIADGIVNHPPGSTTCTALGRPANCAVVAAGEHVWIKYAYVNSASPDSCRLLSAPRAGSTCGPASDTATGGPTASKASQQCFGRQPDGKGWTAVPIACTQGASNGGCAAGAACDDGNPCTTGESFSGACACTGGIALDGASCGVNRTCNRGTCTPSAPNAGPLVVRQGSEGLLLAGTIVTPETVLEGEVLIVGDEIRCVAASCQGDPAAAAASVVQTNGIIYPGLIDTHNHIQFDIFNESHWSPETTDNFTNHDQWPARKRYKALVDTKQYLNGEAGSPVSIGCELLKYGELKGLIAGTTSIVGGAIPGDKLCYGSLARTIDQRPNRLPSDKVQAATLFPSKAADADAVCNNFASNKTDAYLIHIAEGVDLTARKEFDKLSAISTVPGCLFSPKTTIVHGAALEEDQLTRMASKGMSLVWSPRSNIFLYGHGTDLTKTSNVPAALERGILVALAPDWSIGGSQNLLDEIRFADWVDNAQWGNAITPKQLVEMVTKNPAKVLGLQGVLGQLAPGFKADILVFGGDRTRPYDAIQSTTPKEVRLVLVGGQPLYGDPALASLAPPGPPCDTLDICGIRKFACVAAPGGTPDNKLGQTYPQIRETIEAELRKYDAKGLTEWKFSPIAPLYRCP